MGRMTLNGDVVGSASAKVDPREVLIKGAAVPFVDGLYVAINKPLGCTCSHKEQGDLVDDLLPDQWHNRKGGVQTVGRLDKETSGLLLLSDDGTFVHRLTSPKHHVPKRYRFVTENPVPAETVDLFASGEFLLEGEQSPCLPAQLTMLSDCEGLLILHEGRYHQVRRMLAQQGAAVLQLHREAIGSLELDALNLAPGEWVAIDPAIFS